MPIMHNDTRPEMDTGVQSGMPGTVQAATAGGGAGSGAANATGAARVPRKAKAGTKAKPGAGNAASVGRSAGEESLAVQLRAAGYDFEREVQFAKPRRWRFDFVIWNRLTWPDQVAVEIEGGHWSKGRHSRGGKAFEADMEKYNEASIRGWKLLRFTTEQAESGYAVEQIRRVIG